MAAQAQREFMEIRADFGYYSDLKVPEPVF